MSERSSEPWCPPATTAGSGRSGGPTHLDAPGLAARGPGSFDAAALAALDRAASEIGLDRLLAIEYTYVPGGYGRFVLASEGEIEIVAVHWPAGSLSPLHGHWESAAILKVLSGTLVEDRFVPSRGGFVHDRIALARGPSSGLVRGAFHHVVSLENAYAIHAYTPALLSPTQPVPPPFLPALREAWRVGRAGAVRVGGETSSLEAELHRDP